MSTLPPPSGAPLRIAPPAPYATTAPFGRVWRLGIALLLVAGVLVFGAAVSTQTASAAPICATPPLTGTTTISGAVNTFYPGLTTTLAAGQANTTVNVGAGTGAPTPLAVGDLAVVIQMQGAAIDATNTGAYGDGIAGNPAAGVLAGFAAGRYEFVRVASVVGSTIGLEGSGVNSGLEFGYANANATTTAGQQRYQIVRVPQYSGATLSATTPPTAPAWNGSTGGILVLDVAANLHLNGAVIDSTGQGFRPGLQRRRSGSAAAGLTNIDTRTATALALNGQKGEGIAGTPRWRTGDLDTVGDGYPNGDFGRGAPGNAGGGGTDGRPTANDQNSGGGGGGNGGDGGQGGNSWSSNLPVGGFGGAGVAATIDRIVLGGGGGAGSDNDAVLSSSGGAGGGIVLVRSGSMTGTGTITADGAPGSISGQDGAGGAGAGGTVVVVTSASGVASGFGGLTINARGGRGGDETNASAHGPGGGGGGGRVFTSVAPLAVNVSGGTNGIHSGVAYGATPGTSGSASLTAITTVPGANAGANCIDLAVTKTVSPSPVVPGQSVTYTVTATNSGPFPRTGTAAVTVADTVPGDLGGVGWTCAASTGSSCEASGSGSLSTTAQLAVGGTATYTITGTLSSSFTGTLSNTATVTPPNGIPEVTPLDNTATASAVAAPRADLSITKTDNVSTATPGTNVTYTIVASNAGPSAVTAAPITDPLPVGATGGTWTCSAGAGASCGAASGSMPIATAASLAPSSNVTYTAIVAVSPTANGSLVNTATISAPAGVVETNSGNNSATDTDTLTPTGDLSISKTDGLTTVDAGTALAYTIVARNSGPSTILGATVADTLPAQLGTATWTCAATGTGSSCPATGTGNINASVTLTSGGTATFTVVATVAATATGTISNTATIRAPGGSTDPTPGNNSATDTTSITRRADLQITKTDNQTIAVPGQSVTYTIVASNPTGPSAVTGAIVSDVLPASLTGATWSCVAAGSGSSCPASGIGNLNATVSLGVGGTATFTVTATIDPAANGDLVNTAMTTAPDGVVDPTPGNNSSTDTDTLAPRADLVVTKTDGAVTEIPGTPVTYTVVASNPSGPSTAIGARFVDALPTAIGSVTWTCTATGTVCPSPTGIGNIDTLVDLPVGASLTYAVTGTIDAAATGTLSNTATLAAPAGVTDPTPANNSATDDDTLTPTGNLSISKTDGSNTSVPGSPITYTIVTRNAGPSTLLGSRVTDTPPAAITGVTWTCATTGGATCGAASGSTIIDTTVGLPVGATATFIVSGTVAPTAVGTLTNSARITVATGSVDTDGSDNIATDTNVLVPTADLSITKTDGVTSAVPGQALTYTVRVANAGPSAVTGAPVADTLPVGLIGATWTCAPAGGATCTAPSGSGNIATTVNLSVGASATYTIIGTVAAGATGSLVNTAAISAPTGVTDPTPGNNSATDIDTLTPTADLSITKNDGQTSAVPGQSVTYSIVATNNGPSTITGATVADTLPSALTDATWTCAATVGSSCSAYGSGNIDESVTLAPSGTATFMLTATISPVARTSVSNTATITAPGGATDPTPGNNSATDTDTLSPSVDLAVTKANGTTTVVAGTATTYTITVTNNGPSTAVGASFVDAMPADLVGATWTCAATAGSACPASGFGNISTTIDVTRNGSVTFTVTGTVAASPVGTLLVNTATVMAPTDVVDRDATNNASTDSDAIERRHDLSVTKTNNVLVLVPGTPTTYTIVVSNAGPSTAVDAAVTDALPFGLIDAAWTCSSTGGGNCRATGTGSLATTVDLPAGATSTFLVTATVDAATTASSVANTAHVAPRAGSFDPDPLNNEATDTDPVRPTADLSITKSNGRSVSIAGAASAYTIVVANAGPSNVVGARVADVVPGDLTTVGWVCTPMVLASCTTGSGTGNISALVDLPAGSSVAFTLNTTVSATAIGPIVNTADVTAPAGVTDPTPGDNTSTDTDTVNREANLSITKTDFVDEAVPGTTTTYTIVATNSGPTSVVGVSVRDDLPASITAASWTCVASGGGTCDAASGSGDIDTLDDLPVGARTTYTVVASIAPDAVGSLTNTATISAPSGVTDPDTTDNSATDTDTMTPVSDLSISKANGQVSAVPGAALRYTIIARNAGPSRLVGATVTDTPPATLTGVRWTCAASTGSSCPTGASGPIAATVDIAAGGDVTFTLDARLSSAAVGTVRNTASIGQPGGAADPTPGDNTATDIDTVTPQADLSITKTDGVDAVTPGASTTYTIVASNAGPSDVTGAVITDAIPAGVSTMSWTCVASSGATCAASGTGAIAEPVDLASGSSVTFAVVAAVDSGATASIVNTASIVAPSSVSEIDARNNTATDTDTLASVADLSVTKTDGRATVTPGGTTTYTIVVRNDGPSTARATQVSDPVPAGVVAMTWTCVPSTGAACSSANGSGAIGTAVDLPAGATATFSVVATISSSATAPIVNTVTVTPGSGITDPDSADRTATDTDALAAIADLSITKSDGADTAVPGTNSVYTITVANAGPSTATGARVVDTLPAVLIGATWTCATTGTASCGDASGMGTIDQVVTVAPSATVVYRVTALVDPTVATSIANTATVTPPALTDDPDPRNNSSTDTNGLERRADLRITKTDGSSSATPGGAIRYAIVVTNSGPSAVTGATVRDTLPSTLQSASWTCVATSGNACRVASGAGSIDTTVDITPTGSVTFTLDATVSPTATGIVANTATVAAPASVTELDTTNNSATDNSTLLPEADLQITKTDGVSFAVPGRDVTYTIVATNAGPSDVTGAIVSDPLAPGLTGARWTCSATGAARCGNTTGNGALNDPVDLPVGDTVEFVVTAQLVPGARGVLTNTATISTPAGITETSPGDNSATDINTITPIADLSITKTDGRTNAVPGDTITYDIVVSNAGPSAVVAAPVTDVIPSELTAATWTCTRAAGSTCGVAAGEGDIRTTVDLAVGSTATFTVTATVASTVAGTVANSATIDAPAGVTDPDPGDNAASDSTTISPLADVSITKTDGLTTIAAGAVTTYTIVVTNPGPSGLVGVAVDDTLPTALRNAEWACSTTGGAVCGDAAGTGSISQLVDLPAGSTATYTVTATVVASASGTISNTATITLPLDVVDPTPTNNTATDLTTVTGVADLAVTKTNGVSTLVPGGAVSYDIVVSNAGPSDAIGARVTDFLPSSLTDATWTCSSSAGATCAVPSGSGNVDVVVDVPSGATVDLVVTATVAPGATGQLSNTATVAPAAGTTDPNPADNAATDTDSLTPRVDLTVTKTDGATTATPGTTTTYTIVVTNSGPSTASGATVLDPLPGGVAGASWTCVAAAGASCSSAAGTGSIATTVTLAPASSVEFVVVASIDPWARGTLTNVATALAPTGSTETTPGDNVATDIDDLTPVVDLAITNTDGQTVVSPRDVLTYTVVVTNSGPSSVIGASFTDLLPDSLTGATWTCAAAPGSSCGSPRGTGSIDSTIDVAVGGTVTFTVVATVADSTTGQIVSTATVTPPVGTTDANPADNSAVDTDDVEALFALSITKLADRTDVDPGSSLGFTIVVSNAGPSTAEDVTVVDRMPVGLSPVSWTCAEVSGASCGAASGAGSPTVLVEIPAGGAITLVVQTVVSADPVEATDIVNVAVALVASSANSAATETSASAMVRVTPEAPARPIVVGPLLPVPTTPQPPTTSPATPQVTLPSTGSDVTPTPGTPVPDLLPSTGSEIAGILLIAGVMALAGISLLAAGRRRRRYAT